MDMGKRIKQLRLNLGLSQEELGDKIGVKKAAIHKYENGLVVNLKRSTIENLAYVLNTTPEYLMGWDDDPTDWERIAAEGGIMPPKDIDGEHDITPAEWAKMQYETENKEREEYQKDFAKKNSNEANYIKIPVLGKVAAGTPIEAVEDIVDWEDIPKEWLRGGKEYFGLKVKGDSMYPKYLENDTVIVQKTSEFYSGQDCVVYVNGYDATLKSVVKNNDNSVTLQPLNLAYPPRTYTIEEIEDCPVEICGVVVELRRSIN